MMKLLRTAFSGALMVVAASVLFGCGNANSIPAHTASEDKIVDVINHETPEQQIQRIQNGPMPDSAKQSMIKKIKDANGLK